MTVADAVGALEAQLSRQGDALHKLLCGRHGDVLRAGQVAESACASAEAAERYSGEVARETATLAEALEVEASANIGSADDVAGADAAATVLEPKLAPLNQSRKCVRDLKEIMDALATTQRDVGDASETTFQEVVQLYFAARARLNRLREATSAGPSHSIASLMPHIEWCLRIADELAPSLRQAGKKAAGPGRSPPGASESGAPTETDAFSVAVQVALGERFAVVVEEFLSQATRRFLERDGARPLADAAVWMRQLVTFVFDLSVNRSIYRTLQNGHAEAMDADAIPEHSQLQELLVSIGCDPPDDRGICETFPAVQAALQAWLTDTVAVLAAGVATTGGAGPAAELGEMMRSIATVFARVAAPTTPTDKQWHRACRLLLGRSPAAIAQQLRQSIEQRARKLAQGLAIDCNLRLEKALRRCLRGNMNAWQTERKLAESSAGGPVWRQWPLLPGATDADNTASGVVADECTPDESIEADVALDDTFQREVQGSVAHLHGQMEALSGEFGELRDVCLEALSQALHDGFIATVARLLDTCAAHQDQASAAPVALFLAKACGSVTAAQQLGRRSELDGPGTLDALQRDLTRTAERCFRVWADHTAQQCVLRAQAVASRPAHWATEVQSGNVRVKCEEEQITGRKSFLHWCIFDACCALQAAGGCTLPAAAGQTLSDCLLMHCIDRGWVQQDSHGQSASLRELRRNLYHVGDERQADATTRGPRIDAPQTHCLYGLLLGDDVAFHRERSQSAPAARDEAPSSAASSSTSNIMSLCGGLESSGSGQALRRRFALLLGGVGALVD